jgi:hypothetical protein
MSFLSEFNSDFLTARVTKKGRNSIAKGNFVISYFQIGDSEFDYNSPFNQLTGLNNTPYQKVFSPNDKDTVVKYPYKIDSTQTTTTYGVPVQNSYTQTLRNPMGPAGFVSQYIEYNEDDCTGTKVICTTERIDISTVNGTNTLTVVSGNSFQTCEYITLVFDQFGGTDPNVPIVTGQSNSLIYKVLSISGNTIYLDRPTPDLSTLTGFAQVVCNKCEIEFSSPTSIAPVCLPQSPDPMDQHDPWSLNVIWNENPIGYTGITNSNLLGFESNKYISTKQFLGYTTSSGQTINNRATYYNSFDEEIVVQPEEQRILAVIHYSELGDIIFNPERFFKYDDYISNNTNLSDSIIDDEDGIPITDTEYFEVFIPFICYHRNTSNVVGALFRMDTTDYQINTPSPILNGNSSIPFRYLLDEQNYKVGKVFYTKKTIVFDDQELVALLDYRSNRRHTLDAPKLYLVPSDDTPANSLLTGSTNQTIWVSYTFTNSDLALNSMPCNYYSKIQGTTIPTSLVVKFGTNSFRYMKTSLTDIVNGYLATEFKILVQITNTGQYPVPDDWVEVDFTSEAGGDGISFLDKNNIKDKSFILNFAKFNTGGTQFNIENYLKPNYIVREPSNDPKFGEEQPFPGSIRLVRASDIEVMNFLVNLPSTQFTETQNPTYSIGKTKKITEIALLDKNKEPLVVAKTAKPVDRLGTQVFAVKIDF